MNTASRADLAELLERAGARPRGNRHDCSKCGGYRTVTHSPEAFFCHKCRWAGNTITLEKEVGLYRRLPRAEYLRQKRARERAEQEARSFITACRAHRRAFEDLWRIMEDGVDEAHAKLRANPSDEEAWDILHWCHKSEREVLAVITLLNEGPVVARRLWLEGDEDIRRSIIGSIIEGGGLVVARGKFLEWGE